jgi:hypothetical protein
MRDACENEHQARRDKEVKDKLDRTGHERRGPIRVR